MSAASAMAHKQHFIDRLKDVYRETIARAHDAEASAAETAETIEKDARRKEDAKASAEFARSAVAHKKRRERAHREFETLIGFASTKLRPFSPANAVDVGALVDVRIDSEAGSEERTLFILPVGAGNELEGPGGDGHLSVITPASPVGRALMGAHVDDSFEIVIDGTDREWTVVDLC